MQLRFGMFVVVVIVIHVSDGRHFYSTSRPNSQRINEITVVDEKTGIHYNPYSKHHPGRHVCTNLKNVSHPIRTKQLVCKPIYKKYMVRCGNQWCEGVRLVYERYHKDVIADRNHTQVDYSCCPGWTQLTQRSHGCSKPVCSRPCLNGGKCVRPELCQCPPGYEGASCETPTSVYLSVACSSPCQNGGTCGPKGFCVCLPGFAGLQCSKDIDECKREKPCDQICYNTPGSYRCECKENFILQTDGQSCRKEFDEGTTFEAKDLESHRLDKLDKRLFRLEKLIGEKKKNEVAKKDIHGIYENIDKISRDVTNISHKLQSLENYGQDLENLKSEVSTVYRKMALCARIPCYKETDNRLT